MKRFLLLTASTVGLLYGAGTGAQASSIPSDAIYTATFNVTQGTSISTSPGSGTLTMSSSTVPPVYGTTPYSSVTLATLQLNNPGSSSANLASNGWSGALTLTDAASGKSAQLNLSGTFMGLNGTAPSFSTGGANVYFNPATFKVTGASAPGLGSFSFANGMWTTTLGSNTYTIPVADFSFTQPGIPTQASTQNPIGAIAATIEVNAGNTGGGGGGGGGGSGGGGSGGGGGGGNSGGGNTASTPEPSSLVLSCLGLGFAGLASWRRRRSLATQLA